VPWRRDGAGARRARPSRPPAPARSESAARAASRPGPQAGAPPPPASPPPPSPRASKAPRETTDPDAPLDEAEARRLLGLTAREGLEEIESAYRKQALRCHPDKVAHLGADLQALAAAKFVRLGRARDLLASRAARDSMAR